MASKADDVRQLAEGLFNLHNVSFPWIFSIEDLNTADHPRPDGHPGYVGLCSFNRHVIAIDENFLLEATEADIVNTILHEIAHALSWQANHGWHWQSVARGLGASEEEITMAANSKYTPTVEAEPFAFNPLRCRTTVPERVSLCEPENI